MTEMIRIDGAGKTFTLHNQGGASIPVFADVQLSVGAGRCAVLAGPSGIGKSSLLRMVYGNYRCSDGRILVRHEDRLVDIGSATPREILDIRRSTLGYVSQFLRVIPRVSTLDIVSEPLRSLGSARETAEQRAKELLARLRIPERLWPLAPMTFSGGEQQRVNIARSFIVGYPILLLDEPTASLDAANRRTVIELIHEAKAKQTAMLGIFHDDEVREAVGDDHVDMARFRAEAA